MALPRDICHLTHNGIINEMHHLKGCIGSWFIPLNIFNQRFWRSPCSFLMDINNHRALTLEWSLLYWQGTGLHSLSLTAGINSQHKRFESHLQYVSIFLRIRLAQHRECSPIIVHCLNIILKVSRLCRMLWSPVIAVTT